MPSKRPHKRTPQRQPVRRIDGGKPKHEERTFDPYPIQCEVEPWTAASADTPEHGTSTTDPEATADGTLVLAQSFDGDFSGEF